MILQSERPTQPSLNRLLSIAAAAGAEAAVRLHIARGDDLECRDKRGFTPLMIAASKNRALVCHLLLRAGADANAREPGGRDALDLARETASAAAAEAIIGYARHLNSALAGRQGQDAASCAQHISDPSPPAQHGVASCLDEIPAAIPNAPHRSGVDTDDAFAAPSDLALVGLEIATAHELPASSGGTEASDRPIAAMQAASNDAFSVETENALVGSLFGDWEPAVTPDAPLDNPVFAEMEVRRQRSINEHEPIDDSADWGDFEADLPEFAKPLPRADDADYLAGIRRILLLAAREGSVPRTAVEDLLSERGDAAVRDQIAEAQLEVVIGELGAALDERSELSLGNESFKLFVDPNESAAEERELDEAIAFFHDLRSVSNDPIRIYMRSIGQKALLDGKREIAIAQAMEAAASRALNALARWPAGLHALLDAVAGAESSPAVLLPVVSTAKEGADAADETGDLSVSDGLPSSQASEEASTEQAGNVDPPFTANSAASADEAIAAFRQIRTLMGEPSSAQPDLILDQLRALSFRRTFLATLGGASPADRSAEAAEYRFAIAALLASREEMVRGNLRLVYAIAKRYLNSGVPLDDLMQEGNIGLIKAVDRFEWRRGFKFSTMAVWWIRQQISRSIPDTAFNIRMPVHVFEKVSKQRQAAEVFERVNGRPPNPVERADMLGVSVQKMEMLLRPSSEPIPIDEAPLHWDPASEEPTDPMDIVADREIARLLADRLSALGRKADLIIRMRFGIGVDGDQTLEQVGNRLAVTRERIRQIESKAIRRLSSASSREALAVALGRTLPEQAKPAAEKRATDFDENFHEIIHPSASNSDIEWLPNPVREVLDLARMLGFKFSLEIGDQSLLVLMEDVLPVDRDSRKLVADMLQTGFVHEPGMGYRL